MLAPNGPHWFDRRQPDSAWPSLGISVAITTAVFAASFASMRSVSLWIDRAASASPPIMVPLPPLPQRVPKPRPIPRTAAPKPAAPQTVPTEIAPPIPTMPVTPPAVVPISPAAPVAARTDTTTTTRGAQPSIPLGPIARTPKFSDAPATGTRVGAPLDRAGVTYDDRVTNTVAVRDSIIRGKLSSMDELLRTHPMKGAELSELKQSQAGADRLARRSTTAGNAADVHVMQGEGLGGAGAVGGGKAVSTNGTSATVSIPFTLFSQGPTPEQRKKNEKIDAENQLRLRGLQDRMLAKRDSIRTDSLRRDSLAKRRVVP